MLICAPGGPSSGSNGVVLPSFSDDHHQTCEQAPHYIEHVLGVTPLPSTLWDDTNEWDRFERACQAGSTDHDKIEHLLLKWFIRLSPPLNNRFQCRVPVNNDHADYCGTTMHKKWRILAHIRSHLQYRPFACNGQCQATTWYASSFSSAIDLMNPLHYSGYAATSAQQLRLHINPEVKECPDWCVYLFGSSHCFH